MLHNVCYIHLGSSETDVSLDFNPFTQTQSTHLEFALVNRNGSVKPGFALTLNPSNWTVSRPLELSPLTQLDHIPSNIDGLARSSPKWNLGNAFNEMVSATVKS